MYRLICALLLGLVAVDACPSLTCSCAGDSCTSPDSILRVQHLQDANAGMHRCYRDGDTCKCDCIGDGEYFSTAPAETLAYTMDIIAADQASLGSTVSFGSSIRSNLATDLGIDAGAIIVSFDTEAVSRRLGIVRVPLGPESGGGGGRPKGIGNIPLGGMVVTVDIEIYGQDSFMRQAIIQQFGRKQFQNKFVSQIGFVCQWDQRALTSKPPGSGRPGEKGCCLAHADPFGMGSICATLPNANECKHETGKCYWTADCSGTEPDDPTGEDPCCEPTAAGLLFNNGAGYDCSIAGLQNEAKCENTRVTVGDLVDTMCQWNEDCRPVTTAGEDDCCIGATTSDNAACISWWAGFNALHSQPFALYQNPGLDYAGRCTYYNGVGNAPPGMPNIDCTWNPNPVNPEVCDHPMWTPPAGDAECCIPTENNWFNGATYNNGYDCSAHHADVGKCTLPNTSNNCFWDTNNENCAPEPQGCCQPTELGLGAGTDCTIPGLAFASKCNDTAGHCQWNAAC